ncbi:MAG: ABC transporter substrate-binding protein [Deltaproteobacteria bacterium]|nr:ABC transporter substrate-binding protein [Deltaproteobacteria bacterium]
MKKSILVFLALLIISLAAPLPPRAAFRAIGPFSVESHEDGSFIITDGIGRRIYLVPRGKTPPPGVPPQEVVRIPVKSIASDSARDTSLLLALDAINTVKAVTGKPQDWTIPYIHQGLVQGSIVSLGQSHGLDYEQLAKVKPDVFFTWDESLIPMMDELGIPTVITNTDLARDLDTQIGFVKFLAPFFGSHRQADDYVAKVYTALDGIKTKTQQADSKPKVIWGDVYSKRVLVEPGNSWAAQIVQAAGGDYLFADVSGDTCLEIALERFFSSGNEAEVMITYRTPRQGMATKARMKATNRTIAGIKPLNSGKVYYPLKHYRQSAQKLDEILLDLAAIIHPELYPGHQLRYFAELQE